MNPEPSKSMIAYRLYQLGFDSRVSTFHRYSAGEREIEPRSFRAAAGRSKMARARWQVSPNQMQSFLDSAVSSASVGSATPAALSSSSNCLVGVESTALFIPVRLMAPTRFDELKDLTGGGGGLGSAATPSRRNLPASSLSTLLLRSTSREHHKALIARSGMIREPLNSVCRIVLRSSS